MGFATRVMTIFVLVLDCAAFAVLALIPLAGPLGLGDYEVPSSAIAGWFYMAIPLVMAAAGLTGILMRIAVLQNEILMKCAFAACTLAGFLAIGMMTTGEYGSVKEAARARGFAIVAAALFTMNLLVLWRPAFLPRAQTED
jgi:hypothetical protein